MTSVGAAIDDSGVRCLSSSSEQIVVLHGGKVASALDVTPDEVAHPGFVESALVSGKHARVGDVVADYRARVQPVDRR